MSNQILEGVKVLDLANEFGVYCGKMMASMGATVIKVEPPKGDATRFVAPFAGNEVDVEKGLFHAAFNAGKQSITLDYTRPEGKELFLKLAADANVLVETGRPGYMASLGLGYEDLKKVNPKLVMCSITAFGQTGPYSTWNASSELIPFAMSGPMFETGDPDGTPLQLGYNLISNATSTYALVGILACLYSGEGEYLDMSIFEVAGAWRGMNLGEVQKSPDHHIAQRKGGQADMVPASYYKCRDGYVYVAGMGKWNVLTDWMKEFDIDVKGMDDPKYLTDAGFNKYLKEDLAIVNDLLEQLYSHYDMVELMEESQRRGIPMGASETPASATKNPQFVARNFFPEVNNPLIGTYHAPGAPITYTETPLQIGACAPMLGADNEAVYTALGVNADQLADLKARSII